MILLIPPAKGYMFNNYGYFDIFILTFFQPLQDKFK